MIQELIAKIEETDWCDDCNEPLIPDAESVNFATGKWDRHTYKGNCPCFPQNMRVTIG